MHVMRYTMVGMVGWFLGASPLGCADADTTQAGGDTAATTDTSGGGDTVDTVEPPDRLPGESAARTMDCDPLDASRCALPWPSNAFVETDMTTASGLRVRLAGDAVWEDDDARSLARADGASRLSPVLTAFPGELPDDAAAALRVYVAEGPAVGTEVALRGRVVRDFSHTALVAIPLRPMAAGTEHVAAVVGPLVDGAGAALAPDRLTRVALGLDDAETEEEARFARHLAPSRTALTAAGVDLTQVLRLWDFTTRSLDDPLRAAREAAAAAREAVARGDVSVVIDETEAPKADDALTAVRGRLVGIPAPAGADEADADVPFRVLLPKGDGDYRVVMFGHGNGSTLGERFFDESVVQLGAAKVSMGWRGWDADALPETFSKFGAPLSGSARATDLLVRSLGEGAALYAALDGPLGEALAASTLVNEPNPAAGRRPLPENPVWIAASLGGVMGMVYCHLLPECVGGVLNVPGTGWTHWIPEAKLFGPISILLDRLGSDIDVALALAMTQLNFDAVDGATWVDAVQEPRRFLVQVSIDDPVLPNIGSHQVARALDAVPVGALLSPIEGLTTGGDPAGRSAITQYHVDGPGDFDIHDFADRDTAAGDAAQAQVRDFVTGLWAGAPLATVPPGCAAHPPADRCDFTATR